MSAETAQSPLDTPLDTVLQHGRTLVEASAGSGKTHAITTLVARHIVEWDRELDSILVVTFTKAATAELRKRIRQTLKAIQDADGNSANAKDDQARDLLARWSQIEELGEKEIKTRIDAALLEIDRANILTIHGFCQRALTEFAFEAELPFGFKVSGSDAGIVDNVVLDFWQRRFGDSARNFARYISNRDFLPAELAKWIGSLRARNFEKITGAPELVAAPEEAVNSFREVFHRWLETWENHAEGFLQFMREGEALNRNSYPKLKVEMHLDDFLQIYASGAPPDDIGGLLGKARYLGREAVTSKCKKGHHLPENPLFATFDELAKACTELLEIFNGRLMQTRRLLIEEAGAEIRRGIREGRSLGYDDLLIEMRDALDRCEAGRRLAQALRERFPVALIDEFQDTDPTQARIFNTIYQDAECDRRDTHAGNGDPGRKSALYIVGDPKQSIYEFRGADIFAYLSAQQGSHSQLRLDRNWRSAPDLVAAVNAIFDAPLAFTIPEIAFAPAKPARNNDKRLEIDGEFPPPFSFWLPEEQKNNEEADALVADETAKDIVRLLDLASAGKASIGKEPLKAKDIAVLVSNRVQGRKIAAALRTHGGRSVEVDDSSVFKTREAGQLRRLLLAIANPGRQDYRRSALTGDLFGLDNEELFAATDDDENWSKWSQRFGEWSNVWLLRGVGAMLRGIIDGAAGNLLRFATGPRRLTNLYHLAELLQTAETENRFSPARLLAWFARRLESPEGSSEGERDAFTLRLDSDEDLVRILTIHKSKGLEFPVVYLPFAWYGRQISNDSGASIAYHLRDGDEFPVVLDLAPDAEASRRRSLEEFGESVRRLYVALTRARERCVIAWTRVTSNRKKELPPLAWLLHRSEQYQAVLSASTVANAAKSSSAVPDAVAEVLDGFQSHWSAKNWSEFRADVEAVAAKCPGCIQIRDFQQESAFPALEIEDEPSQAPPELECREFKRPTRRIRQMTSFTALTADHAASSPAHVLIEPGTPDHDESDSAAAMEADALEVSTKPEQNNTFNFPRGIHVGTCLHRIFEILDESPEREIDQVCKEQLARVGIEAKWRDTARAMVENTLATELREPGQSGFRLLEIDNRLTELEFLFPVNGLRRSALGNLLARHGYPNLFTDSWDTHPTHSWDTHHNNSWDTHSIDGFLRGFIDLTFEHECRWYVLDYKSNWLGDQAEDYESERVGDTMRGHRYQLQYLIYLLALHRYLGTRLPDYDYERHIGGAFYLFLRGMDPAAGMSRGVWFDRPSKECIEALDEYMRDGGS